MSKYEIIVPATSANLGTGFDCMGLALSLYNTFIIETSSSYSISGCDKKYCNENNLFILAYKKGLAKICKEQPIKVTFDCKIPVSRGLGSSASLIVGGLLAVHTLFPNLFDIEQVKYLACEIEGHPDNVIPAILGGLTLCAFRNQHLDIIQYPISKDLLFTVLIPSYEVSTLLARSVLPEQISLTKAVSNVAGSHLFIQGLQQGDEQLIKDGTIDYFHEPYRKHLIKDYQVMKDACKNALAFLISGSGSTCLAISKEKLNLDLKNIVVTETTVEYQGFRVRSLNK